MSDPVDETFLDQYLEPAAPGSSSLEKQRPVRQGLPPTYRMRHDAHYVDELETRRRPADAAVPAFAFPTSIPVTFALRDMTQELAGVASCFNLVPSKSRPLRERMGLTLARVGVQRSMRAFHALRVLLDDVPPELEPISLTATIEQTLAGFEEELRATDSRFEVDLGAAPIRIQADPSQIALVLQACIGTLISLIEASGRAGTIRVSLRSSEGVVTCELQQETYRLSADQFARLTDLEWSERPGGIPAGIALAAASRIAQAHGGLLDGKRTESGCALILTLRP